MVMTQLVVAIEAGYGPVLSTMASTPRAGESDEELVYRLCRDGQLPHSKVQLSTVGVLRDAGFVLVRTLGPDDHDYHHDVAFPEGPDLDWCQRFVDCFQDPVANPAKATM